MQETSTVSNKNTGRVKLYQRNCAAKKVNNPKGCPKIWVKKMGAIEDENRQVAYSKSDHWQISVVDHAIYKFIP